MAARNHRTQMTGTAMTLGNSIALAISVALTLPALAADPSPSDQIRHGEVRQQQLRVQTEQVARQLDQIIDEFKRNGLDGADVDVLRGIRSILGKLSESDMKKVIELLQQARSINDTGASQRVVASAIEGQKNIVVQLRQLLLEYQRQQQLHDLSLQLARLAERQNVNLGSTVDLAKLAGNRTATQYDDTQKA